VHHQGFSIGSISNSKVLRVGYDLGKIFGIGDKLSLYDFTDFAVQFRVLGKGPREHESAGVWGVYERHTCRAETSRGAARWVTRAAQRPGAQC
jgi:hypothetical protein